ncbi:MAG: hypothetical protein IPI72_13415 [Flavobacteriales bacterium]|nr:hypothetical protein [Flavobacteriales bacterium]
MCQFLRQLLLAVLTMAVLQATAQEPANDDCANALPVACGTSVSGSTMSANLDDALPASPP